MTGLTKQAYEEFYEGSAGRFDQILDSPWYQFARHHVGDVTGRRVLEIACGLGAFTCYLARQGACACGIDIAQTALVVGRAQAAERGLPASFVCGSIYDIPFPSGYFDVIVSCETLEHLERPALGVQELRRVSRAGAVLLLTTPNYFNMVGLYRIGLALRKKPYYSSDKMQPVERFFLYFQIKRLLRSHGFRVSTTESYVYRIWIPKLGLIGCKAWDNSPAAQRLLRPFGLHTGFLAQAI